jgi:hypothetical protein
MSGQLQVKTYIKVLHHQIPSKESVLTSTMVMNRKWDVNQVAYSPTGYKLVFTQAPIQREIRNGIPWGSLRIMSKQRLCTKALWQHAQPKTSWSKSAFKGWTKIKPLRVTSTISRMLHQHAESPKTLDKSDTCHTTNQCDKFWLSPKDQTGQGNTVALSASTK